MEHINKALRSVSYAFPMLVQKYFFSRVEMIIFYILHNYGTKLLQKREMRKDIVIELSYKGFSRASDYS